jgi:hypothetical protein
VNGWDWGREHGYGWPFASGGGPAETDFPTAPPLRGLRLNGPLPSWGDHMDVRWLHPPSALDGWLQEQLSEYAGLLGVANTLEGGGRCVPGTARQDPVTRLAEWHLHASPTPATSVHWTPWIGFTSWKDVKVGRIDWETVWAADAPYRDDKTVYAWFNVVRPPGRGGGGRGGDCKWCTH